MSFGSLQHMQEAKVHRSRVLRTRDVPPSGFGYPRDGLLPSHPGRFCFIPAALMGFTLRSFLLLGGSRRVWATVSPPVVGSLDISSPKRRPARTNLDFWVLTLQGIPCDAPRVWHGHRRMLPWVFPFPGTRCRSGPSLRRVSPRTLSSLAHGKGRGVTEYRSIGTPPHPWSRLGRG